MGGRSGVVSVGGGALKVLFRGGGSLTLRPVPMRRMPSASAQDWLLFQRQHVVGTQMSEEQIATVQMYMRVHRTEALTDGSRLLTVAGDRLALCEPEAIH